MKRRSDHLAAPRRTRRAIVAIAVGVVLTVLPIAVLYLADVPLGQPGKFIYRYTPILNLRLICVAGVVIPVAFTLVSAAALMQPRHEVRLAGYIAGLFSIAALVAWNFTALPEFQLQHYFNFRSPSHDGAFLNEAEKVSSVGRYLRGFDRRIQFGKEQFGGTRVIANPPLMTVVFRWVTWAFPTVLEPPGPIERLYADAYQGGMLSSADPAASFRAALTCAIMLMLAGFAAVGLGRLFLSPAGAFVFAVIVTFNPMTLHFSPGKDPAQLLTVNLMLWAWFAGWQRRSWLLHGLAGAMLAIGMGFGLIHLWVAIAALAGTMWHGRHGGFSAFGLRHLLPTALGGAAVCLALWVTVDWNLPATVLAVARRWKQLQPEINYNRPLWLIIGLPSVLLFVGPAIWTLAASALRWRWRPGSFGARLAVATGGTMAVVYFIGIPYELPRLWVVFLPPLVLGLMAIQPLARGRTGRRATTLVLILLAAHIFGSAAHWSLLDVRESEYRLRSHRLWN